MCGPVQGRAAVDARATTNDDVVADLANAPEIHSCDLRTSEILPR